MVEKFPELPTDIIEYDIVDDNGEVLTFKSTETHIYFFDNPNHDYSELEHIFWHKLDGSYTYIFNTDGRARGHMDAMMGMGFDYTISRRPSEDDVSAWLMIQDNDIEETTPQDIR